MDESSSVLQHGRCIAISSLPWCCPLTQFLRNYISPNWNHQSIYQNGLYTKTIPEICGILSKGDGPQHLLFVWILNKKRHFVKIKSLQVSITPNEYNIFFFQLHITKHKLGSSTFRILFYNQNTESMIENLLQSIWTAYSFLFISSVRISCHN